MYSQESKTRFDWTSPLAILLLSLSIAVLTPPTALSQPQIWVSTQSVYNDDPLLPGGSWSTTISITNEGDVPLTVHEIGTVESDPFGYGLGGWLGASQSDLYVLPGVENSVELEIQVDASDHIILRGPWDTRIYESLRGEVYLLSDSEVGDSVTVRVEVYFDDSQSDVTWHFIDTDSRHRVNGIDADADFLRLAISSSGAAGLPLGWHGLHMDYTDCGNECGTRVADQVYLHSGSPYVLINDGGLVSLTVSNYQLNSLKPHHWQNGEGSPDMVYGIGNGYGSFNYRRTGELVSTDGKVGLVRSYYAPLTPDGHSTYIIVRTQVYSADGLPHTGVTIGNVIDWDIPSDIVNQNTSGASQATIVHNETVPFVYVQGTDTLGSSGCQSNTRRLGGEAMLLVDGWSFWFREPYGVYAGPVELLHDTSLARDGTPMSPPVPDAQAWWEDISAHPGINPEPTPGNLAVWTTYVHDATIEPEHGIDIFSVISTVRDGTLADLSQGITLADMFYELRLQPWCCACCDGHMVGDVNLSGIGGDETPTIGDISAMVAYKFMGDEWAVNCLDEADVNQSGGCCSYEMDVTIGDISILVDYLFITGPENMTLPPCEW